MKKALVLGSDSRICLAIVRSLGRGGVETHIACHEPDPLLLRSRYLARLHRLPLYKEPGTSWRNAVRELLTAETFDLVLPCTEPETIACHSHRTELATWGRFYLPSVQAVQVLFDKVKTTELARSVGVRTPRERVIQRQAEACDVPAEFGFPLVLKPLAATSVEEPGVIRKVCKAYTEAEFRKLLPLMLEIGPITIQENFLGAGVGVELLMADGEPLLAFQHVRVHEPMHGGVSSYRKSVALSPELLEASLKIFRALRYTGVAMAEYKVSRDAWVFLEVNARFWGSLPLAVAAGADFPLALFQFLVDGRRSFPQKYRAGFHCRNWSLDLEWQEANWRADRADPTLATRPLHKIAGDALLNLLTLRERSDAFTLDDPGPGMAEVNLLLRRIAARLGKALRLPVHAAGLHPEF